MRLQLFAYSSIVWLMLYLLVPESLLIIGLVFASSEYSLVTSH
jgi:hypothetical protein